MCNENRWTEVRCPIRELNPPPCPRNTRDMPQLRSGFLHPPSLVQLLWRRGSAENQERRFGPWMSGMQWLDFLTRCLPRLGRRSRRTGASHQGNLRRIVGRTASRPHMLVKARSGRRRHSWTITRRRHILVRSGNGTQPGSTFGNTRDVPWLRLAPSLS
jgi:hypothetical protein